VFDEVGAFDTGLNAWKTGTRLLRYVRRHALDSWTHRLRGSMHPPGKDAVKVQRILGYLWTKHQHDVGRRDRRTLRRHEPAARGAHYYGGNMLPSLAALLKSFLRCQPAYALSAVMHNWLARR